MKRLWVGRILGVVLGLAFLYALFVWAFHWAPSRVYILLGIVAVLMVIDFVITSLIPKKSRWVSLGVTFGVLAVFAGLAVGVYSINPSLVKKLVLGKPVTAIHLEADGSGDYPSLEKAVQRISSGGTITLGAGTYRLSEPLEINKPISLIGAGIDQTIFAATTEYYVVRFSGEGSFVLQGLTAQIQGGGEAAVLRVDSGEINFSGCRFKGDGSNGPGLLVIANARGLVKACESTNNGSLGIAIQGQAQVALEHNNCVNNEDAGIGFFENAQGTARQNTCTGNGIGIVVGNQARADLEENTASRNQGTGIAYQDTSSGTVRLNECSGNGDDGILVADDAQVTLEENTCSSNGIDGIGFSGNTKSVARENTCANNLDDGICCSERAEPVLEANTCTNNERGIGFFDFAKGAARRNQCSGNGNGISVSDQSQPSLEANIVTENSSNGIHYSGKAGGSARQNDCSRNEAAGISVIDQARPKLEQNTCNDNRGVGIGFAESGGGSAIQNECSRNGFGIWVQGEAQPLLEGNVCTENSFGILVDKSADPDLRENYCHDNVDINIEDQR